jgi:hypothetical protein
LIAVNVILNSKERSRAADPMIRLIASLGTKIHNDLFLELGWSTFGKARFGELLDIYEKNQRSPDAFSGNYALDVSVLKL